MGRPVNKKIFGPYAGTGMQVRLTECWIPGEGSSNTTSFIVNQTGENSYLVKNASTSVMGVVQLMSSVAAVGQGKINVSHGFGTGASATARLGLLTVTVAAGGTGYSVGNVLTLVGGTATTAATVTVSTVSGGAVTGVTITNAGVYSALPSSPVSTTGGAGTGATLTVSAWKVVSVVVGGAGGTGYNAAKATFSSGAATATVVTASGVITAINVTVPGSYTTVPNVTLSALTETVRKIESTRLMTHQGGAYFWKADGTTPTTGHVALPLS